MTRHTPITFGAQLAAEPAEERAITIPAADDRPLAATLFLPWHVPVPSRVVLVAAATGVRRSLYRQLADWLVRRHGVAVITWDWRGIAGSRQGSPRRARATMRDWGERDLAGVIEWARDQFPGAVLVALGHSFGGQSFGLAPNAGRLHRMVTIASQVGWYGHWPARLRWRFALLWHLLVPGLTRALGYFPSRRLGLGEDLPPGVALEWAKWCSRPEFLGDWAGHERIVAPMLSLGFSDDTFAPPDAVRALAARYTRADLTCRIVTPADVGRERIGHWEFFRNGTAPRLWEEVGAFLAA